MHATQIDLSTFRNKPSYSCGSNELQTFSVQSKLWKWSIWVMMILLKVVHPVYHDPFENSPRKLQWSIQAVSETLSMIHPGFFSQHLTWRDSAGDSASRTDDMRPDHINHRGQISSWLTEISWTVRVQINVTLKMVHQGYDDPLENGPSGLPSSIQVVGEMLWAIQASFPNTSLRDSA